MLRNLCRLCFEVPEFMPPPFIYHPREKLEDQRFASPSKLNYGLKNDGTNFYSIHANKLCFMVPEFLLLPLSCYSREKYGGGGGGESSFKVQKLSQKYWFFCFSFSLSLSPSFSIVRKLGSILSLKREGTNKIQKVREDHKGSRIAITSVVTNTILFIMS